MTTVKYRYVTTIEYVSERGSAYYEEVNEAEEPDFTEHTPPAPGARLVAVTKVHSWIDHRDGSDHKLAFTWCVAADADGEELDEDEVLKGGYF